MKSMLKMSPEKEDSQDRISTEEVRPFVGVSLPLFQWELIPENICFATSGHFRWCAHMLVGTKAFGSEFALRVATAELDLVV